MKKLRLLGVVCACLLNYTITSSAWAASTLYGGSGFTLFEINPDTGSQTLIGDDGPSVIDALAFSPIPIPASVWLFGSGLLGLVGMARRKAS